MPPDKSLLSHLSLKEKYEWVDALLVSIHEEVSARPIEAWERELIRERLEAFAADPNRGRPWREVLRELEQRA